jgi:hypothetical protein
MTAELPLTLLSGIRRQLGSATAFANSPFTGSQQVQDWGGRWWQYELEFSVTQGDRARRLSAFFDALAGGARTFTLRDPSIRNPSGLGAPVVNGAGQSGSSLATGGYGAVGLRAGDFFSLGAGTSERLYRVTADAVPVAGSVTLQIIPPLRSSPPNLAVLNVTNPGVVLRPQGPIPTDIGRVDKHRFTLVAREAI